MYRIIFQNFITDKSQQIGNNIMVNCPYHIDKTPSMSISINPDKPVYHCFSCGKKGSWIGFYMEQNNYSYAEALKHLKIDKEPIVMYKKVEPIKKYMDFSDKIIKAHNNFFNYYIDYGKLLYNYIGLTVNTAISCKIGILNNIWIFPIFKYPDCLIIGYELRNNDFKVFPDGRKCKKPKLEKDYTLNCLSITYRADDNNRVIICEGFKDSYFIYQWLYEKEKGQKVKDTIMTPSCGVNTLIDLLQENKLEEFEKILIILDNDKAGNEVKEKIKNYDERYSFFDKLEEDEDFEIYYKRTKGATNV